MFRFCPLKIALSAVCLAATPLAFSQDPESAEPEKEVAESPDISHLSEETQALVKDLETVLVDIEESGESLEKLEQAGDLYARLGYAQRAVLVYEKAIREYGGSEALFLKLSRVLLLSRKPELALEMLKIGRSAFPESEPLQLESGKAYLSLRKGYAAQAIFKELIEKDPENSLYRYYLADSFRIQKKWDPALEIVDGLVDKEFDYLPLYLMKGDLLLAVGKPGEGVTLLETVREEYPESADAKQVLAKAYRINAYAESEAGRLESAVQQMRNSLELDPEFLESKVGLASLLSETENFAEAEQIFQEILTNQPDFLGVYIMYGKLLSHLGREREARAAYLEGLKRSRKLGVKDAEQTYLDLLGRKN